MNRSSGARPTVAIAWAGVVLVPVMFLVGLVVAYVLEGVVAGDTVGDERSLAADLLGVVVVALLVVVPAVWARRSGRRAETDGDPRGRTPAVLGPGLAALAIAFVLVQVVLNASRGTY